jgi:hypothetical protein
MSCVGLDSSDRVLQFVHLAANIVQFSVVTYGDEFVAF